MLFSKKVLFSLLLLILQCSVRFNAEAQQTVKLQLLSGENWWGGAGHYGYKMPFDSRSNFTYNLYGDASGNQSSPMLISSKGRWIWSDEPFRYQFKNDSLVVISQKEKILLGKAGNSIASSYRFVSKRFFPCSGHWPDSLLVTAPQYNLWIELQYNPNHEDVLLYADNVLKNGFPAGVLMIDDNWSNYYGEFDFNKDKFPDPKKTIAALQAKGFKVMLWISPFISPDSEVFRELQKRKLLLMNNESNDKKVWKDAKKPLLIEWWNGYSACLDLTNPDTKEWLISKLKFLQKEYGVDGYKFDAGDSYFYDNKNLLSYQEATPNDHSEDWAEIGLSFPLNEYRAMWKMAGQPLVQRLGDKSHDWQDLKMLIPNTIVQQLLGHTFTCPDMIGGGQIASFTPGAVINQNLMVRSAQVHAMMPMMQFSVAPWRILDSLHLNAVQEAVALRQKMMPRIMNVLRRAAEHGEPALRSLEYNYPNRGYEKITDEFMLGDDILVAPVISEKNERTIVLPPGRWVYKNKRWKGGRSYQVKVSLEDIPVFIKDQQVAK